MPFVPPGARYGAGGFNVRTLRGSRRSAVPSRRSTSAYADRRRPAWGSPAPAGNRTLRVLSPIVPYGWAMSRLDSIRTTIASLLLAALSLPDVRALTCSRVKRTGLPWPSSSSPPTRDHLVFAAPKTEGGWAWVGCGRSRRAATGSNPCGLSSRPASVTTLRGICCGASHSCNRYRGPLVVVVRADCGHHPGFRRSHGSARNVERPSTAAAACSPRDRWSAHDHARCRFSLARICPGDSSFPPRSLSHRRQMRAPPPRLPPGRSLAVVSSAAFIVALWARTDLPEDGGGFSVGERLATMVSSAGSEATRSGCVTRRSPQPRVRCC